MPGPGKHPIQKYFDRRAATYPQRLRQPFLRYFYRQRLEAALRTLPTIPARLLDIGAGTGPVYDELQARHWSTHYTATDISAAMLAQSRIPEESRLVGTLTEVELPFSTYDAVFMLGVTTYLTSAELEQHLHQIRDLLQSGGTACISFTHRRSLDFQLRRLVRRILPQRTTSTRNLTAAIPVRAYCPDEVRDLLPAGVQVVGLDWLNQTLPPGNRWFPHLSVWAARLRYRLLPSLILPVFSSDFLLTLRRG